MSVRLRPVEERDLELLERIDLDPSVSEPFEWRGFRDRQERRRRWETDGYLSDEDTWLVVSRDEDGAFAGIVVARSLAAPGPGTFIRIGILLFPEHRGHGYGTTAQRLLAEYLFETRPVHRVEAITSVDNTAEQRALEKAGFAREGVLRGIGFGRGEWRDGVIYSRLRTDP